MARTVPTPELEPGLTLAAAVHDRSGRLLIPAGMTLQGKHLRILHAWGVTQVEVASGDPAGESASIAEPSAFRGDGSDSHAQEPEQASAGERMEVTADELLADRFQHCDTRQFPMDGIYRIAHRVLLDELSRTDQGGAG